MTKATELQIGDFVLVDGKPRRVESITKKKIGYHLEDNKYRLHYARLRQIEPIEMTRVMLDHAGISEKECISCLGRTATVWKRETETYEMAITDEPSDGWYVFVRDSESYPLGARVFRYLHQLQQVCRMCEIEIDWMNVISEILSSAKEMIDKHNEGRIAEAYYQMLDSMSKAENKIKFGQVEE